MPVLNSLRQQIQLLRTQRIVSLAVLLLASALCLIALTRPLVRGDSIAYLAWLDSIALDGDIDFANQVEQMQPAISYQLLYFEDTDRYVNLFPFGVAILQIPFYHIGHVFAQQGWLDVNPVYFQEMQGVTAPYSIWIMIGTGIMTLFTVGLAWRIIAPLTGPWTAAGIAWLFFFATPLLFYSSVNPLNSHSSGAFMMTIFLVVFLHVSRLLPLSWREKSSETPEQVQAVSAGWWLLMGISAAMMAQVRWQLILVAIPVWVWVLLQREWRGLMLATGAAFVVMLPLPFAWQELFGEWLHSPNDTVGKAFMLPAPVYLPDVIGMWLSHSPVILLSLAGMLALWRINRVLTLIAVGAIASQLLMSAWITDWHGSQSYGLRRMTELYPFYVMLAGAFVAQFMRHHRWRRLVLSAGFVLMTAYTSLYMVSFFNYTWTNPYGKYADAPPVMIDYFLNQPHNLVILHEVWYVHMGPYSWQMPGP